MELDTLKNTLNGYKQHSTHPQLPRRHITISLWFAFNIKNKHLHFIPREIWEEYLCLDRAASLGLTINLILIENQYCIDFLVTF